MGRWVGKIRKLVKDIGREKMVKRKKKRMFLGKN